MGDFKCDKWLVVYPDNINNKLKLKKVRYHNFDKEKREPNRRKNYETKVNNEKNNVPFA